jgi:ubiquitin carboxyl-terminal hydrolase 22/27/51
MDRSKKSPTRKSPGNNPEKSGCLHTRQAISAETLRSYELAVGLAILSPGSSRKRPQDGGFRPRCGTCNCLEPILVCVDCSYTGCLIHIRKPHAQKTGHGLSVDLSTKDGLLYCSHCADYIYDDQFEDVRLAKLRELTSPQQLPSPKAKMRKLYEKDVITPSFQSTTGLRGFYNMGATCFMSVILQSLIHNPVVRNFFLAGGHDRTECRQTNCLACCVDQLFSDFFGSNNVQGYGIGSILTASFNLRRSLAGASEQDAHEFLQFILDEFHKNHFKAKVFEQLLDDADDHSDECDCVTHRTFYGQLESRIRCHTCGNITATVDPMMDLSLEIKSIPRRPSKAITLVDCLDKFTSSEKLDAIYYCNECNTRRTVDKQLFVKRMPTVLSIQMKVGCI